MPDLTWQENIRKCFGDSVDNDLYENLLRPILRVSDVRVVFVWNLRQTHLSINVVNEGDVTTTAARLQVYRSLIALDPDLFGASQIPFDEFQQTCEGEPVFDEAITLKPEEPINVSLVLGKAQSGPIVKPPGFNLPTTRIPIVFVALLYDVLFDPWDYIIRDDRHVGRYYYYRG